MYEVSFVKNVKQQEVTSKSLTIDDLYTLCLRCGNEVEGKDGPGIVPSKIVEGEGRTNSTRGKTGRWRQAHLCERTSLLCLDIEDHELSDEKEEILAHFRQLLPNIEFVVWTTHSHGVREVNGKEKWKPNHPRLRLVVPLKRALDSHEDYPALFEWASNHFGGVDTKASDPSRISFLPRKKAKDAELEPWIHHEDGEPLDPETLPGDTSLEAEKEKLTRKAKRQHKAAVSYANEKGLSDDQLRKALEHIDCYDDRSDWLKIGMALHHYAYVEGRIDSEVAFELWDEWSKQSDNYGGTEKAWASFAEDGKKPVVTKDGKVIDREATIGTLIYHAKDGGWTPPKKKFAFWQTDDAYIAKRVVSDFYEQTMPSTITLTRLTGGQKSTSRVNAAKAFDCEMDKTAPVWDLGSLWVWDRKEYRWRDLSKAEVLTRVADYSGRPVLRGKDRKPAKLNISASKAKGVYELLKARAETDHPDFFEDSLNGVQCKNAAVVEQDGRVFSIQRGHPLLKQRHVVPVEYDFGANCPKFMEFLNTCFMDCPDKEERIKLLQEYTGAMVFGRAWETQKILLLKGPGGGGKTQFIEIVSALFNEDDVASVSPQDMSDQYRPAQLVNARANIVGDIDKKELLTTGLLKQVTGTDRISVEQKYKDSFTVRVKCGHLFSCNKLPQTTDNSAGFWSRWHLCVFPHNFRGTDKEEKGIGEKIVKAELAGVLNWAIRGYARLVENDLKFTVPSSSELEKAQWKRDCDPVELFVYEKCEKVDNPKEGQTVDHLHAYFRTWADSYGRGQGMARNTFGEHLTALGIDKKRIQKNGERDTYYAVKIRKSTGSLSGVVALDFGT